MNRWKMGFVTTACAVMMAAMATTASAQSSRGSRGPGGDRGSSGGGSDRGSYDPAASRQRYLDRIREQLASPDDEWKVLQPRLEKVLDAQREGRTSGSSSGYSGRSSRGGDSSRGGSDKGSPSSSSSSRPETALSKASTDLKTAVDDKNTSPEVFAQRLAAVRQAKERARVALAVAQKELRELVTQRQEAILVTNGYLE